MRSGWPSRSWWAGSIAISGCRSSTPTSCCRRWRSSIFPRWSTPTTWSWRASTRSICRPSAADRDPATPPSPRRGRHEAVQPEVDDQLAVMLARVADEGRKEVDRFERQRLRLLLQLRGGVGQALLQRLDDRGLRRVLVLRQLVGLGIRLLAARRLGDPLIPERDMTEHVGKRPHVLGR